MTFERRIFLGTSAAALLFLSGLASAQSPAPIKVGAVLSVTGPAAFLGEPLTRSKIGALALALTGVSLIAYPGSRGQSRTASRASCFRSWPPRARPLRA